MLEQLTALLAASLGGGAAILVLLTLGPLLTRKVSPHWRYWAWAVVAVSLMAYPILGPVLGALFPAPIQLDVPQMVAHGAYDRYNAYHLDNQRIVEAGAGGAGGTNTYVDGEQMWYSHHVHYTDRQGREVSIRDNDYLRTVTVEGVTSYTVHWTGVIYGAYRGVTVLFLLWMAAGYGLGRRRLLRWSTPAGEEDLAALEQARQETGCRKKASLYRCPKAGSPLLLGFAHPVILLPETLQEGGREAALAHELTHLKRRDTGYLLLLTCVRCIHWFNPLVWNMVRTARRDMELCCDDDLLAGRDQEARRAYGRAVLDQMTAGKGGRTGLTTGFTGDRGGIFLRFRAIMDTTPKRRGRLLLASASILILLAGGLVSCAPAAAESSGGALELSGADAGPGEMLPLEERFESYNRERGRSLPVSRGEWAGEVRYRFADQEQGVEVLVGLSPGKGGPLSCGGPVPEAELWLRHASPSAGPGRRGGECLFVPGRPDGRRRPGAGVHLGRRRDRRLGGQLPGIRPVYRGGVPHHPGPGADALPGAGGAAGTAGRSSHLSGHRPRRSVGGSSPVVPRV